MSDDLLRVLSANFPAIVFTAAQLNALAPLVPTRQLPSGRTLFAQGAVTQAFYAVASGEIEARFTGLDGTISVLEHVQPPRLFGLAAFAAPRASSYEAIARRPSRVLVFGPAAYALLMDQVPGFARALLREFAQRHDGTLHLLQASRHASAAERFKLALSQLASERQHGEADAEGWRALAATQGELAALANLSRQTVNQLLRQAVQAGELRSSYGRIWLKS